MSLDRDLAVQQCQVIDRYIQECGFKSLSDFETEVSAKSLKDNNCLPRLNILANDLDRLFPVHDINLRRTGLKITSETLAMNILRSLLSFACIPWRSHRTSNCNSIRLLSEPDQKTIEVAKSITNNIKKAEVASAVVTTLQLSCRIDPCFYSRYSLSYTLPKGTIKSLKITEIDPVKIDGCPYSIYSGGNLIYYSKIYTSQDILPVDALFLPVYCESTLVIHNILVDRPDTDWDVKFKVRIEMYQPEIALKPLEYIPWNGKILKYLDSALSLTDGETCLIDRYVKCEPNSNIQSLYQIETLKFDDSVLYLEYTGTNEANPADIPYFIATLVQGEGERIFYSLDLDLLATLNRDVIIPYYIYINDPAQPIVLPRVQNYITGIEVFSSKTDHNFSYVLDTSKLDFSPTFEKSVNLLEYGYILDIRDCIRIRNLPAGCVVKICVFCPFSDQSSLLDRLIKLKN